MGISLAPESLRSKCLPKGEAYGGTQGTSCGPHDAGDPGHRGHSVGHGPGPPEDHGGWLRWLPGQAHQRAGAAGDDARDPGEVMTTSTASQSAAIRRGSSTPPKGNLARVPRA